MDDKPADAAPIIAPADQPVASASREPVDQQAQSSEDGRLKDQAARPFGFGPNAGLVIARPRVTGIFWGRDYGSPGAWLNDHGKRLAAFLEYIVGSPYLDFLDEYGVARGTYLQTLWYDHDPNQSPDMNEDDMKNQLRYWFDNQDREHDFLEVPNYDDYGHAYVIFTPSEVKLHLTFLDITNFSGYHISGQYDTATIAKDNMFLAVMQSWAGTADVSHELAEMCTDRDFNGWHGIPAYTTEIGDVCNDTAALVLNDYGVSPYWRDGVGRCLSQDDLTPPPPPATLRVTVTPDSLPLDQRITFSVAASDAETGQPVTSARVIVRNYSPARNGLGGDPLTPKLVGVGSSVTDTEIFHAGRETVLDSEGHPHQQFDLPPAIEVAAAGYTTVSVSPFNDIA